MKRYAMILGAVLLVLALSGCGKKAVVTVSDRGVVKIGRASCRERV